MPPSPLILDQSMRGLSIPQQFFAFANAYRNSAEALCERMINNESEGTWPNAAVVLMTAAHATELFLKGLILAKTPDADIQSHNINLLARDFRKLYPDHEATWNIPFKTEFLEMNDQEIETLIRRNVPPSIRYRYPVAKDGNEWNGVSALRAATFKPVLQELQITFQQLEKNVAYFLQP
jgi:hypothetical protein